MKQSLIITLMILSLAVFAVAGTGPDAPPGPGTPTTDVLGAHLNYGRGCAACHAPHNGALGNGADKSGDLKGGTSILWGQDVGALYSVTITTGSTNGTTGYVEVLPASMAAGTPDVNGLITCLSCHDGNYAKGAMMQNAVYETLPSTYGTYNTVPTLLGAATSEGYLATHPVGLNAAISCGAPWNWDCTITNGVISMTGTNSANFVKDYGFFVSPSAYNSKPIVVCTTCHNQHLMNVVEVTTKNSGMAAGPYGTMFFMVGPYSPNTTTAQANSTAQFCRQCHGANANEFYGANLPTVF